MNVLEVILMVISTLSLGTLNWFLLSKSVLWIIHQLQLWHWIMKLPLRYYSFRYWSIQLLFCLIVSNCSCYPILLLYSLDAEMHDSCSVSISLSLSNMYFFGLRILLIWHSSNFLKVHAVNHLMIYMWHQYHS